MSTKLVIKQAEKAKLASYELGITSTEKKNKSLRLLADNLKKYSADIIKENKKDLSISKNLGDAFLDRLELNNKRIKGFPKKLSMLFLRDKEPEVSVIFTQDDLNKFNDIS